MGVFKVSKVVNSDSLKEAEAILQQIYAEEPKHWPAGQPSPSCFDAGCYLVREKQSNVPVGFLGFQIRHEYRPAFSKAAGIGSRRIKVGYYSVGILKKFRKNGFAKEALTKLLAIKSADVDQVRALIVETNKPSIALADSLGVEKWLKRAAMDLPGTLLMPNLQ